MNVFLILLIIAAAGATAFALVRGLATLAQGKDVTGEKSNRYMFMRVGFQALTILLVLLLLAVAGRGLTGG